MNSEIFKFTLGLIKPLPRCFSYQFTPFAAKQINDVKYPFGNDQLNAYTTLYNKNRMGANTFSYNLFIQNNFEKIKSTSSNKLKASEIFGQLAVKWKSMDVGEKLLWKEKAINEKKKFSEDIQDLLAGLKLEDRDALEKSRKETQKEQQELKALKNKKANIKKTMTQLSRPQRPTNNFSLFMKEQMKEKLPPGDFSDRIKKISEMWKSLSQSEKDKYKKRSDVLREEYQSGMIAWENRMLEEGHQDLVRSLTRRKIEGNEKNNELFWGYWAIWPEHLIQSFNLVKKLSDNSDESLAETADDYIRLFKKNMFNSGLRAYHMFVKKRREDLEKEGTNMPRKLISFEWKAIDPDTKKILLDEADRQRDEVTKQLENLVRQVPYSRVLEFKKLLKERMTENMKSKEKVFQYLDEVLEGSDLTEYIRLCRLYQTGNVDARAYILFYKHKQAELNQEKSSFKICQMNSKTFGSDWKNLSPEKKAVFLKEGEEQKRQAYENLLSFIRKLTPQDRESLNKRLRNKILINPFLYETSVVEFYENLCQTVTYKSNT